MPAPKGWRVFCAALIAALAKNMTKGLRIVCSEIVENAALRRLMIWENCVSNFYLLSLGVAGYPAEGGSGKAVGFEARVGDFPPSYSIMNKHIDIKNDF